MVIPEKLMDFPRATRTSASPSLTCRYAPHDDKIHRDRRYRPQLSQSARPATFEVTTRDEHGNAGTAAIAGEHPLTVYVDKREILTLMTLGAAPEALVIGYLRNQRLVDSIEDLVAVQVDWEVNAASVYTRNGRQSRRKMAHRTKTTGCGSGTVFGDLMADIDAIHLPAADDSVQLTQSTFTRSPSWCASTKPSTSRRAPCTAARCSSTQALNCSISSGMSAATTPWMPSPG